MQPKMADKEYSESLKNAGPAFTAMDGDRVVMCGGLFPQWEGRAIVWALVGVDAGKHMIAITRGTKRFFGMFKYRRLETAVKTDFVEGHRWARMLGFANEGTMTGWAPDGCDYDLYARIENG